MDYTLSPDYATHAGTGNRMHEENAAVTTVWSEKDANSLIWSLMEIVKAAGLAAAQFDEAVPATYQKLLTALRSAGVFTTPAQFDNTTKAATTAFVKTRGLQASGLTTITSSAAIGLSSVGGTVLFNSAGAIAPTLPAANAVPAGARIEMFGVNAGVATVTRAGADTIQVNNTTVTGLPVGNGESLILESDGVSTWIAVGGSAQLSYSKGFSASVSASGYQKLPSGLIIQWGTSTTAATGGVNVTLPIAFPNLLASSAVVVSNQHKTVSQFTAGTSLSTIQFNTPLAEAVAFNWIAIGF